MTTIPASTARPSSVATPAPALLAELRDRLIADRADEERQARAHRELADVLVGQADPDSGLAREAAELAVGRAEEAVAEIDAAVQRLDAGTYGACERCGDAIAPERLQAIPHARTCVRCPGQRTGPFW
jgi:RNA polymerase-binding transcription factor DksA